MRQTRTECDGQYAAIFAEIVGVLEETYTTEGAYIWLNSRNLNLDCARPIDLINGGDGVRALDEAYRLEGS